MAGRRGCRGGHADHRQSAEPMSPTADRLPSPLSDLIATLAGAVPARARRTFLDLLLGAALTTAGHVTAAILSAGLSRSWTTYFWFLEYGRWSWLAVMAALLDLLVTRFTPSVWHVIIDDTLVERCSARAPGAQIHYNHAAKPNRSRFLLGQGWVCLAAVVERGWNVGAVPLLLRLVRRRGQGSKLAIARLMMRRLGDRLGHVRLLVDAWSMRRRLVLPMVAAGHCVIGRVRAGCAPGAQGYRAVPCTAAPLQTPWPAAQVRRAPDAGAGGDLAGQAQCPDPLPPAGSCALSDLLLCGPLPERRHGAGGLGGVGTS